MKAQTNSADPDQTASEEAVWLGSSLFDILTSLVSSSSDIQDFIWDQKEKNELQ